jgi:transcriptional regulator of acetoin/glycerol metabolism
VSSFSAQLTSTRLGRVPERYAPSMSDDWRLRVVLDDRAEARELAKRLAEFESQHDLSDAFHDRVVVSHDDAEVFCYGDTREQVEAAQRTIRSIAGDHGWQLTTELKHWHPVAEEWEDPDQPLPGDDAALAAERAEAMHSEDEESRQQGFPDFEVRVRCPSRRDAERLAERLRSEGIPTVHRWEFVVLGAADEDSARALAERIRREAPPGSAVVAEASVADVASESPLATPFNNPFAVFGGLGG